MVKKPSIDALYVDVIKKILLVIFIPHGTPFHHMMSKMNKLIRLTLVTRSVGYPSNQLFLISI